MANDNILKAIVDVSAPGAVQTLDEVAKSTMAVNNVLIQLGKQGTLNARSVADAIGKLKAIIADTSDPKALQKLNTALTILQNKAKEFPPILEKTHVASLRASSSAINLSHSLGLLPAEASHLTHGLESIISSFETLKEKSGSTSGALKGLASTIGQGLGLGLAITLLSSFVEELFHAEEGVNHADIEFEKFKDHLERLSDGLKNFKGDKEFLDKLSSIRDGINKTGNEIALLTSGGKLGGVDNLGILDLKRDEKTNTQTLDVIRNDFIKVNTEIDKAVKLAAKFGIALSSVDPIPKSVIEGFSGESKDIAEGFNLLIKKRQELLSELTTGKQDAITIPLKLESEQRKKFLEQLEIDIKFEEDLRKLQLENAKRLAKEFLRIQQSVVNAQSELFFSLNKGITPVKFDSIIDLKSFNINLDTLTTDFGEKFKEISKDLKSRIENLTRTNPILILASAKVQLTQSEKDTRDMIEKLNDSIHDTATDAISSLSDTLGEALAGGDLQEGFRNFANIVAIGLQSIGKQMVAAAPVIKALKEAIKKLDPAILLPAGLALIAIGAALRQSIQPRALGGPVSKGQPYLVGEQGPELFVPDSGGKIVSNKGLQGSAASISSGGMNISVTGYLTGRGSDLVAIITQEVKKQLRLN